MERGWRPPSHVPTREVVPPVLNIKANLEPWVRSFVSPADPDHWDTQSPLKDSDSSCICLLWSSEPYISASWSWGESRAPLGGVGKGHPPSLEPASQLQDNPSSRPWALMSCVGSVTLVSNCYPNSLRTLCTWGICLLFLDILQDPQPFLL